MNQSPVVVALDYNNASDALKLVDQLSPDKCRLKVGKELFVHTGSELVKELVSRGFDVFLDLKFHDIPNTVAKAVCAAASLGVWMVNVHASGGSEMMQTARQQLNAMDLPHPKPLLIAVTVLTSQTQQDLQQQGIDSTVEQRVLYLAELAKQSGMDGVVCSAQESALLKQQLGQTFKLVTPGIRPANADINDQKRIVTPQQAIKNGSDYLVIGRPITQAADPADSLQAILSEVCW